MLVPAAMARCRFPFTYPLVRTTAVVKFELTVSVLAPVAVAPFVSVSVPEMVLENGILTPAVLFIFRFGGPLELGNSATAAV